MPRKNVTARVIIKHDGYFIKEKTIDNKKVGKSRRENIR